MRSSITVGLMAGFAVALCAGWGWADDEPVQIGSKSFTESVILGEILAQVIENEGVPARHRAEMGGTRMVYDALVRGDLDVYVEYTGTLLREIFVAEKLASLEALKAALEAQGIRAEPPLGFENPYAIGMKRERAVALGIRTISDLRAHPNLRFGFSNEFMDRDDGWPGLRGRYRLPQSEVGGMDHDLAYRALEAGELDVTDFYNTDAKIKVYDAFILEDDQRFFPPYAAWVLYRADLERRYPQAVGAIQRLAGRIDDERMRALNAAVEVDRQSEAMVAARFLEAELGIKNAIEATSAFQRILQRTGEHIVLVGISLLAAVIVGLGLGVLAAKKRALETIVLASVEMALTIPGIALLALLIGVAGIGAPPTIIALFIYTLLPIVRNTHAGLRGIPAPLRESAITLDLTAPERLFLVELPLAAPSIFAGIKTAVVLDVSFATLGALINAGGYGQPILTGMRLNDMGLILEGMLPAMAMAVLLRLLIDLVEPAFVSRGLRIKAAA